MSNSTTVTRLPGVFPTVEIEREDGWPVKLTIKGVMDELVITAMGNGGTLGDFSPNRWLDVRFNGTDKTLDD